jgi:ACS family tartrate transporter-like MFS transporter
MTPIPLDGSIDAERTTMRKVSLRILPIVLALYIVAYLDRVSLSYAQLKMGADLGIDPAAFGFAASIFFAGYVLLEMPSNAILYRVGARIWLARIGITWGIITIATAFVQTETQLIIARILLGIAEAGLAPGVIFYVASFFPAAYKARAASLFFLGAPLAGIIGGPLAGYLLDTPDWMGLASWRWLFIVFGIPSVVIGLLVIVLLSDSPAKAKWLDDRQRTWLLGRLGEERARLTAQGVAHTGTFLSTLRDKKVLRLASVQFLIASGIFGIAFWLPQIVKSVSEGSSNTTIGLLTALPYIVGAVSLVVAARHSDKTNERVWHVVIPVGTGGVVFILMPFVSSSAALSIALLCIASAGLFAFTGPFWAIIQQQFVGYRAALGIAAVNSLGAGGGLVAPYVFGLLTKSTGGTTAGVVYLGAGLVLAAAILALSRSMWIDARTPTEDERAEDIPLVTTRTQEAPEALA